MGKPFEQAESRKRTIARMDAAGYTMTEIAEACGLASHGALRAWANRNGAKLPMRTKGGVPKYRQRRMARGYAS